MYKVRFNSRYCLLCRSCEIACVESHSDLPFPDLLWEYPHPRPRLTVGFKKTKPYIWRCVHCKKPKCMEACTNDAISKDNGRVVIDMEKCQGCWDCVEACPFDAIIKDEEINKAVKCDLCGGNRIPACATACITDALTLIESD